MTRSCTTLRLQNLPVRFAIDRAGLVGADGATHAGSFDIAYLGCLPNMVIMAASDEAELVHMVATCAAYDEGPIALRYPRGDGSASTCRWKAFRWRSARAASCARGTAVARRSRSCRCGARLQEALAAADQLEAQGLSTTVADARFAKPLDVELMRQLAEIASRR